MTEHNAAPPQATPALAPLELTLEEHEELARLLAAITLPTLTDREREVAVFVAWRMKTKWRLASAEQAQTIARLEAQLSVTHRFRLEDAAGHVDEQLMQAELIKQLRADLAAARQESLDACQILRGLFSGGINGVPDDVKAVAEEVARYVGLAREAVRQEVERLGGELLKANEELSKLRWAESDNTAR